MLTKILALISTNNDLNINQYTAVDHPLYSTIPPSSFSIHRCFGRRGTTQSRPYLGTDQIIRTWTANKSRQRGGYTRHVCRDTIRRLEGKVPYP